MALASLVTLLRLRKGFDFRVIDSHFAFPDGFAAVVLGRILRLPVTITLRGTEVPLSRFPWRRHLMVAAVNRVSSLEAQGLEQLPYFWQTTLQTIMPVFFFV